jgi:hypothetical protein
MIRLIPDDASLHPGCSGSRMRGNGAYRTAPQQYVVALSIEGVIASACRPCKQCINGDETANNRRGSNP